MKSNENNSQSKSYFIYVRSTGEKIPVTKTQHDYFYGEASRIRNREQKHGRCMCPKRYLWKCDGDCLICEYRATGDVLSLDVPNPDGNGCRSDYILDDGPLMEDITADRLLLAQLLSRLCQLDPEADKIIQLWIDNPQGISDRKVAEYLGRPQRTFSDQMKRYRAELRKIRGY